jgi:hypothetical protein
MESGEVMIPDLNKWGLTLPRKQPQCTKKVQCCKRKCMTIKKTKAEADKCKLHHKNLSVAPSMDVYNNHSSQSLSLRS